MKRLIAISLTFAILSASFSNFTSAVNKGIFHRPLNLGCNVKYVMPSFSNISRSDDAIGLYYSSQGKIFLQNADSLAKCNYVSVSVAQPRLERKWWKLFLKKGNVDYGENRFSIRVSSHKVSWWRFLERLRDWLWNSGIYVKYAIVLTTPDEERILETPEVKEGQKKKEVLDSERFRKEVEKQYGKDKLAEFKEAYINKLLSGIKFDPTLDPYDPFNMAETGHINALQENVPLIDQNNYYTKKEAAEINKKIREEKAAVLTKFAQKSGNELITEGEVTRLSSAKKDQTFRLIVNNNIGEGGDADLLTMILAYQSLTGETIVDDSSIRFAPCIQSELPDRFNNPLTETDRRNIERAYKTLCDAKHKPGFFSWLWDTAKYITPDIVKDFFSWSGNRFLGWFPKRKQQQHKLTSFARSTADATKKAADDANKAMLEAIEKAISAVRASQDPQQAVQAQAQNFAAVAKTQADRAAELAKAANATKATAQAIQLAQELEAAMKPGADPGALDRVMKSAKALAPAEHHQPAGL